MRAFTGSLAPSQKLTRALVAIENDMGVIQSNAAVLEVIWWAAAFTVPWRAMKRAINVNDVTSTVTDRALGTPRRNKLQSRLGSGLSSLCHMR